MLQKGKYPLLLGYVHRNDVSDEQKAMLARLRELDYRSMEKKWGFHPLYSCTARLDLLKFIPKLPDEGKGVSYISQEQNNCIEKLCKLDFVTAPREQFEVYQWLADVSKPL